MSEPNKQVITFYDIPSIHPNKGWSPNTWATRYCLNYKGLAYQTVWVEYPDIEGLCIKIGARHTSLKLDGSGRKHYTLPVIHDPSTNTVISDSADIALYLDKTYPSTPPIFYNSPKALQLAFFSALQSKVAGLYKIIIPESYKGLNEASQPYFRRTREAYFGKKLEELSPIGPERDRHWRLIKDGMDVVDGWLAKGDSQEGQVYISGNAPGYVDIILASRLMWMKAVFGEDSELWKDVSSWNGGRWERILKSMEKYASVV